MTRFFAKHPLRAAKAVIVGLLGRNADQSFTAANEEKRLAALCRSIALYRQVFGRLPEKLEDLCFDNYHDPRWRHPLIDWRGEKTFHDLFGHPYSYWYDSKVVLVKSPGLEAWMKRNAKKANKAPEPTTTSVMPRADERRIE